MPTDKIGARQFMMSTTPRIEVHFVIATVAMALSSGCASIISGRHANVAIDTYPTAAHVTIHDKGGREVASVNTPAVVSLERNGKWFLPAQYTATIEAPGYQTTQVPIRSTINPWILGNVVVGGIPGLIVDDATGACWKPQRDAIRQQLVPAAYAQQPMVIAPSQIAMPASYPTPTGPANQMAINSGAPIPTSPVFQSPAPTNAPVAEAPPNPAVARGPVAAPSGSFYR